MWARESFRRSGQVRNSEALRTEKNKSTVLVKDLEVDTEESVEECRRAW